LSQQRDLTNNVSELLSAANEALNSAIQMDPNYYSSRLNMLIWKYLSGERSEIIKKEIELVNLYFPLETAHWVLYALSDVSSGNVNQGQNKLRELSRINECASRIICQIDSLDCEVALPKSMNEKIPEVNLFGDSFYKTRGIGFKKNFVLVPYTSWKVDIYQSQGIDLYNVKFINQDNKCGLRNKNQGDWRHKIRPISWNKPSFCSN
jgi:hypothetical protein